MKYSERFKTVILKQTIKLTNVSKTNRLNYEYSELKY
jgi:hypothetical protein